MFENNGRIHVYSPRAGADNNPLLVWSFAGTSNSFKHLNA